MLTSACVKQPVTTTEKTSIGPFSNFTARLIVIEPKRRWQVMLQWHADSPDRGDVRLTHAATGTVIELRWLDDQMQLRSTQSRMWEPIEAVQLGSQGIVIPPQQLASILLGQMPGHFINKQEGLWESRASGNPIRLQWTPSLHKLTMTDIKHGRRATMLIQP
ncbi:hypothetical protein F3F96_01835 [Mariprofundus sp. NF]|uniref:hypothetical protein n=1 Tax=Mariprofundus sp. NF TaxID=2608716 RepID=UPI0015A1B746|nr:hypothetical protein [Mariprofundus sp. NF]NWF37884.1 hypothetical protein [Mariprofundus sp. NF]